MATFAPGTIPTLPNQYDADGRRMGGLLDVLIALRLELGHSVDGITAPTALGPEQMREVRVLLDCAIESAKEILGSIPYSLASDGWTAQSETQADT